MASTDDYDKAANDIRRPGTSQADGVLDTRELIRHATLAASSHNTQPWKFRIQQDSVTILPDFSRRCPVVDPDDSHLFKSLGCAAENLVHAAKAQSFSADVRFDPDEDGVVILLHRDASAHPTDLYRAIPQRQCVKTAYDGKSLEAWELDVLEKAGERKDVRVIMLLSAAQKDAVIDYVARGNIDQLTDRAFRDELVSWIRFNPNEAIRTGDGLSGRVSGQPALPTWLAKWIIKLVLTPKGQAETDATNIKSSAGVAVFVSREDDKAAWVEAGRAYERFALQATALNVRTAFINQPIEVRSLRSNFEQWLNLSGENAQLMVRFGHGGTAPFSLRRPIDDVVLEE
ncbi:Acg family FMN-binding oxidoreductase [Vreelandella salicampi]|uniref:Nitroreductase family protein n=1 Tax=Vreelandella salicampi TaxID=1449798 RepID=A0A7Z0RW26_9GAMM|nr:nitroreductase family protein [Halomonas salicampi]NYS62229.1 nitroreductase family protein [Halomonas salicampi]